MKFSSELELKRSALNNNIHYLRSKIKDNTRLSSVVKGNAYGHGIEGFVPLAEKLGIDHFSVFSSEEAVRVRNVVKSTTDVMIMGMIDDEEIEWAILNNVQFYVFDVGRLEAAVSVAKKLGTRARVHLEVETGMNRTGLERDAIESSIEIINNSLEHLEVSGICTHYAGAENLANNFRVSKQIEAYQSILNEFKDAGIKPVFRHTSCSAATINYPETQYDLVRIGILLYGFWPSPETFIYREKRMNPLANDPLKRVISWKTRIMSIKHVKTGEYIGYGTSYLAHKDMTIATIPVGYSHGFGRTLSNVGRALIRGERVGVVGIVNMNMTMLDVSEMPNLERGEEVVLIGIQKDKEISVASFSDYSSQLNYESLTRLQEDIPRIIID